MEQQSLHIALLIMLPVLGGMIAYAAGAKRAVRLSLVGMVPGACMSALLLLQSFNLPVIIRWLWMPDYELGWRIDEVSAILIALVYLISILVHLFSAHYMKHEPGIHRYFAKLGFFTSSMLGLLAADHLLLVFVFWELVGFSSYLLIGFWFSNASKAKAAREAFMINRVADAGLLIGVILMIVEVGQPYMSELSFIEPSLIIHLAGFGLLIGALGKSAQFPFFGWLPKAMAGPTPVSALIHAATMVAAGVYLLFRVYPFLTPVVLGITATIGAMTALMAAIAALSQFDIKKVLAYSTISQLGYMVMGVGVSSHEAALFHLWTHAFFKAGLFLGAGAVIHYFHQLHADDHSFDAQDMRLMGGLRKALPITFISFSICGLALAGFPFFSGFLSKEGILSGAWIWSRQMAEQGFWVAYAVSDMAFFAALLTPIYIGRQVWLVFFGDPRTTIQKLEGVEPTLTLKLPLLLLALGSVWLVHAFNPFNANGWWLATFVFGNTTPTVDDGDSILMLTMVFSVALAAAGLAVSYIIYRPGSQRMLAFKSSAMPDKWFGKVSFHSWYMEAGYDKVVKGYFGLSRFAKFVDERVIDKLVNIIGVWSVVLSKVLAIIDREVIDGLVNFSAWLAKGIGNIFTSIQSGRVQNQLIWMILLLLIVLVWIQF